MAIKVKSLNKSVLPTSEGDVYVTPVNKSAIIKGIRLVNTTGSSVTVNLFVRRATGGTSYRVLPKDLSLAAGAAFIDDSEITLEGLPAAGGEDRLRADSAGNLRTGSARREAEAVHRRVGRSTSGVAGRGVRSETFRIVHQARLLENGAPVILLAHPIFQFVAHALEL